MSVDKNVVSLFDMDVDDSSMSFLDKKTTNRDGIYRPVPKDAKDKVKGYTATIRFLPNVLDDMTIGPSAIERYIHYVKLPDHDELNGYYDSQKQFGEKCPLNLFYWKLFNSKNQAEVERAELIKGSPKYYSYILVIEDKQHPELEGKILIFPYGIKIKEKINLERQGENTTGVKCNVFDPANGKDFRLIVKEIGNFPNYDSSSFREVSPLKYFNAETKKFQAIPVEFNEEKGKNVISNPKVQTALFKFLTTRDEHVNFNEYLPKKWTDEDRDKVERIIEILSGREISAAKSRISANGKTTSRTSEQIDTSDLDDSGTDLDSFFETIDEV
jgi:hypothetical protein